MTIVELFQFCQNIVNKDVHGMPFGIDQFNNILSFVNLSLYQDSYATSKTVAEQGGEKLSQVLFKNNDLRNFVKNGLITISTTTIGGLTIGRSPYPADMEYPMMLWASGKDVEIVSAYQLGRIRSSVINRDFSEHPVAIETDGYFEIYPNDLTGLLLTYLKRPTTPYLDYCLDTNDVPVYMGVGSYIVYNLSLGYYNLYNADSTLAKANVTHDYFTGSAPSPLVTYTSLTSELEWADTKHTHLANMILERMGVNLRAPEVAQWAAGRGDK